MIPLLFSWCKLNGIRVNTSETKVMVFGSKSMIKKLPHFEIMYENASLQKVLYNYLGVTLDWQLNYNLHMKIFISTVSAKLKHLQRMRSLRELPSWFIKSCSFLSLNMGIYSCLEHH